MFFKSQQGKTTELKVAVITRNKVEQINKQLNRRKITMSTGREPGASGITWVNTII